MIYTCISVLVHSVLEEMSTNIKHYAKGTLETINQFDCVASITLLCAAAASIAGNNVYIVYIYIYIH